MPCGDPGPPEMPDHARSFALVRLASERGQIEFIEDLGITPARIQRLADPVRCAFPAFSRTVSPLIIWNAWASVVDSDRSHSQVSSRSGLPKVFKNATPPEAPGSWAARSAPEHAGIVRAPRRPG